MESGAVNSKLLHMIFTMGVPKTPCAMDATVHAQALGLVEDGRLSDSEGIQCALLVILWYLQMPWHAN